MRKPLIDEPTCKYSYANINATKKQKKATKKAERNKMKNVNKVLVTKVSLKRIISFFYHH